MGAEACSTEEKDLNWFEEWGEIFSAIPDKLKSWNVEEYTVEPKVFVGDYKEENPLALDIVDPGCSACMNSYRNQLESGFFEENNTILMVYPIPLNDGYKFANSGVIARYFYATALVEPKMAIKIIDRIFTERDENMVNYQSVFNNQLSNDEAERLIKDWLKEFGLEQKKYEKVKSLINSAEVEQILAEVSDIVENKVHVKGIPTMLYNGGKHYGLYKK